MWPQPPAARSTIWMRASLPAKSDTSHDPGSKASLPPGLTLGPVAVRTTLPLTSRFMQVFPSHPPPPMRKVMNLRSILNAGEVSVPVAPSPPKKELTSPFPSKPSTVICPGNVPFAGPVPKAVPSAVHAP